MKLLLTGDWHLRFKKPEMRLDENYFETQSEKIQQILGIAKKNNCNAILQPGDFFDSVDTPWFVVQHYMKMFLGQNIKIYTIPGQHDLRYHTRDIENTPLGVLKASGAVKIVGFDPLDPQFYGCWWGEDIFKPLEPKDQMRTLLIHKMIIQKKMWEGQTDFVYGKDLLKDYNEFDLIVSGDNHKSFIEEDKGRFLINCGSLMRSNIDQVDHKPVVYIYDTEKRSLDEIFLKVKSAKKILNLDKAQIQKERDEKLDLFIDTLRDKGGKTNQFDFIGSLYEKMDLANISSDVRAIIEEVLR